jgi:hypothetical protein
VVLALGFRYFKNVPEPILPCSRPDDSPTLVIS